MVIDDVFAVIAEGTRRELLGSLRNGDKSVGALVEELEVSQPTVSKHLKVLREAGLVTMRAEGQKRYYSLEPAPLEEIVLWLRAFGLPALPAGGAEPRLAAIAAGQVPAGAVAGAPAPATRSGRPLFTATDPALQPNLGRTVGRAAERAADLLGQLPKFRRRRS